MFEIPFLLSVIITPTLEKGNLESSLPAWCRVLHIVVYESKIAIIFFLGNTNHGILFLGILVIVCANLTSNAVIFKRLSQLRIADL